ncbi:cystathionine gamma-lyase-like isoform X1 [Actinia tenebrosa]|uniref:cystathionine gamma-lyase n=1 Tax=Actinia tenebrosa TaxID=6105 RepID=A0A6P8HG42_ACTTE|nr:cystathionine gamma-lyase-like isoform X1 [Actinia tenebrosa]
MADKIPEALPSFPHFGTIAIHDGQEPEQWMSMGVVPPISMATTFKQDSPGQHRGFEYSRSGNPTRQCFEKCVAGLEGAKYAFATASGLAASLVIAHLMKSGDHIACVDDVYGGTNRYFNRIMAGAMGIEVTMNDFTNLENVEKAIKPNTKIVWIETPTNPLLKLIDIKGVADIVHQHEGVILVVDNTFMSSYFQRPLSLGADVVMHSVTKYMNGHSDVVMGVLATSDEKIAERIRFLQNAIGPVPSPFDCYLANRGLKTLHLRMRQHEVNALTLAKFLEKDPRCTKVVYPGLESHPQHELAKKQMTGFGGMVTFYIKGGLANATEFLKKVKVFTLAESLGGFESLCEHPAIMTHASVPPDQRDKLGISDTLIRLSVGLEDTQDIIDDIDQALAAAMLVKN